MRLLNTVGKRPSRPNNLRARPRLEELETRVVPYTTSGSAWLPVNGGVTPQLITLSFVPDGTWMTSGTSGNVYSNTFSTFSTKFGSAAAWENAVITAAQTWAQYANINFSIVSDNGTASGQGLYQQGDPGMGDIRVAAYPMTSTNVLGLGYYPPTANNYSVAGDISFNSRANYTLTTGGYDLQTVALHEIGHALGMAHSSSYGVTMYPAYTTSRRTLSADDIAGIQAIYGPRSGDAYGGTNALVPNNSFQNAADITSQIGLVGLLAGTAQLPNLDINTPGQAEYFKFTAPLLSSNTLTVSVQSAGLSLLRPSVTLYAADMTTVLASGSAAGSYTGGTITLNTTGVTPGQVFYVKVTGADTTAFGTGAYALTLNLGAGPLPSVTPPNTSVLDGLLTTGGSGLSELNWQGLVQAYLAKLGLEVASDDPPVDSPATDRTPTDGSSAAATPTDTTTAPETSDFYTTDGNDPATPPPPPAPNFEAFALALGLSVSHGAGSAPTGASLADNSLQTAPGGLLAAVAGQGKAATAGLSQTATPGLGELPLVLSQAVVPQLGKDARPVVVPSSLAPNAFVAPAAPRESHGQPGQPARATLSSISSGSAVVAAADRDAADADTIPTAAPPAPGATPRAVFDDFAPASVLDQADPVAGGAPVWRPIHDTIFVDSLSRPGRPDDVAPVPDREGAGSPLLAAFALLGGAWWVGLSEPEAPRSRPRPPGRRAGG
jgi:hypothetical protein